MSIRRFGALWSALMLLALLSPATSKADELVRGLVVDRSDDVLWLGLSAPVDKGAVFDVSLVPGSEVIARTTVISCTPDEPFVAKARLRLLVEGAFIPIGAYAEINNEAVPETDEPGGYEPVALDKGAARRLTLRAGVFFPTDSQVSDETSSMWPAFQIGYVMNSQRGVETEIAVGYYHQDGDFTEGVLPGTRDIRVLPVTIDVRVPISTDKGWKIRAGIGAYSIRDKRVVGAAETSRNVTTFGWQAGFGYVSKKGHTAELYYTDVSSTEFRGAVFSLGARF